MKPDAKRGVVLHAIQELMIRRAKAEQQGCDCYIAKQHELSERWQCRAAGLGEAIQVLQDYAERMQDNVSS